MEAIKYFREEVLSEFGLKGADHIGLLRVLGEIVEGSQAVETMLQEMVGVVGANLGNRGLVGILIEKGSVYGGAADNFKNVIECRNWAVHSSCLEWAGKRCDVKDGLFHAMIRQTRLYENENELNKIARGRDRKQWVMLKAIITKHLVYEMLNWLKERYRR